LLQNIKMALIWDMSWILDIILSPRAPDMIMKVFLYSLCMRNCMHWLESVKVCIVLIICRRLLIKLWQSSFDSSILGSSQTRTLFSSIEVFESLSFSACGIIVGLPWRKITMYSYLLSLLNGKSQLSNQKYGSDRSRRDFYSIIIVDKCTIFDPKYQNVMAYSVSCAWVYITKES
jgi:hypothetical protein